jgi:hypothetical protein
MALVPFRLAAVLVLAACAAPPKPAKAPAGPLTEELSPPPLAIEADSPQSPAALVVPNQCGDGNAEGICGPPAAFVQEVCGYPKPDIAIQLFAKPSPWTRAYLRLNVDAWYTGTRSARVALKLDEEVIVLHHPNPTGGIIVNGGGEPFDVMRLDGNCATLSAEEVTLKRPPSPKHPPVPWKQLDQRTRDALLSDPTVADAIANYDEACAGPSACAKAGGKLTTAILDFMARGGKIPLLVTQR